LVLYISLYFHAFVAKQQQLAIQREKENIESRMKGLQGTLEDRAKLASELQDENKRLREEVEELKVLLKTEKDAKNELQEKDTYLEEKVEVLKQLLEQENEERAALEKEVEDLKTRLSTREADFEAERKKNSQLSENKITLEEQVSGLSGQVTDLTTKFTTESEGRKKETEEYSKRSKAELKGIEVLKKNLHEHLEDLSRWQKYLDLDTQSELDFSGEIRPQILQEISKENFDEQLLQLSKKLEKENDELTNYLKQKEMEAKVKKANEKKKKERQKKNEQ